MWNLLSWQDCSTCLVIAFMASYVDADLASDGYGVTENLEATYDSEVGALLIMNIKVTFDGAIVDGSEAKPIPDLIFRGNAGGAFPDINAAQAVMYTVQFSKFPIEDTANVWISAVHLPNEEPDDIYARRLVKENTVYAQYETAAADKKTEITLTFKLRPLSIIDSNTQFRVDWGSDMSVSSALLNVDSGAGNDQAPECGQAIVVRVSGDDSTDNWYEGYQGYMYHTYLCPVKESGEDLVPNFNDLLWEFMIPGDDSTPANVSSVTIAVDKTTGECEATRTSSDGRINASCLVSESTNTKCLYTQFSINQPLSKGDDRAEIVFKVADIVCGGAAKMIRILQPLPQGLGVLAIVGIIVGGLMVVSFITDFIVFQCRKRAKANRDNLSIEGFSDDEPEEGYLTNKFKPKVAKLPQKNSGGTTGATSAPAPPIKVAEAAATESAPPPAEEAPAADNAAAAEEPAPAAE